MYIASYFPLKMCPITLSLYLIVLLVCCIEFFPPLTWSICFFTLFPSLAAVQILDFTSLDASFSSNSLSLSQLYAKTHWWHRVAWAFLRVLGPDGSLKVEKKLGLQLFKPVSAEVIDRSSKKKHHYSTEVTCCSFRSCWCCCFFSSTVVVVSLVYVSVKSARAAQGEDKCHADWRVCRDRYFVWRVIIMKLGARERENAANGQIGARRES